MSSWRRTLYAVWTAQLLTIIGFSLRTPFLPLYVGDLGVGSVEEQALWAGIITGGGGAVMALTAPLWGIAADRYGRKPMVLRSMFAGSVTISLMALATAPWHLLALRFVEGAFTGTVAASTTLVATTVPKERLGFSLGLMQMAIFSGSSVGPLIGGVLGDTIGYDATFVCAGSLLFLGGIVVLVFARENFQRPERADAQKQENGPSTAALLLGPAMIAMILVLFVLRIGNTAIQPIVPLFVEQLSGSRGAVSSLSGLALGVMGLTSAVAAVVLGRLADRVGQRGILVVTTLLAGVLYLPQAAAQSVPQLVVFLALLGIAAGGVLPAANAVIAYLTPEEKRGAIYGFTAAATSFGSFIGPVGGAALAAAVSIRATFLVAGVLTLLMGLWVWRAVAVRMEPTPSTGRGAASTSSRSLR